MFISWIPEPEISEEVSSFIKSMKNIGISNFHIVSFVQNQFNITITVKDIAKVMKNHLLQSAISETEEMENYMQSRGKFSIFQSLDGITGFFTLTFEEEKNLKAFGDFVVIDGTSIPNFLNWSIIPISLQGNYGELLSGGVAFASSESKEFYYWLIKEIQMITSKLRVIISDEDSTICPAIGDFSGLFHIYV